MVATAERLLDLGAALRPGTGVLWVRDKRLGDRALATHLARFKGRFPEHRLWLSDRPHLASLFGIGTVQLSENALPLEACRRLAPDLRWGRSVHSTRGGVAAAAAGADHLVLGHVYATPAKPNLPPCGLEALVALIGATELPVYAVGGITAARLPAVVATGVHGVCAAGAVADAPDPRQAIAELAGVLRRADRGSTGKRHRP